MSNAGSSICGCAATATCTREAHRRPAKEPTRNNNVHKFYRDKKKEDIFFLNAIPPIHFNETTIVHSISLLVFTKNVVIPLKHIVYSQMETLLALLDVVDSYERDTRSVRDLPTYWVSFRGSFSSPSYRLIMRLASLGSNSFSILSHI